MAIKSINNNSQFTLYPNPLTEQLTISSNELVINAITVTDVLGRELFQSNDNLQSTTINLKSFSPGIYFVQLKTKEGVEVRRVVKE